MNCTKKQAGGPQPAGLASFDSGQSYCRGAPIVDPSASVDAMRLDHLVR